MKNKILLVEDEPNLGNTLREFLEIKKFSVEHCSTVNHAIEVFKKFKPNIVLMDLELPDGNGYELSKKLKDISDDFTLLFLSAQNDPQTRLKTLELGAQDYITKPFELKELILRLERIVKNMPSEQPDILKLDGLSVHFKEYKVINANGETMNLGLKEMKILELLYSKSNEVVPRELIIDKIWPKEKFPTERTVDNYIVKLRRWCETDASSKLKIISIRGIGYKLEYKE